LIGGCASTAVRDTSLVPANLAVAGDILILTKPLGTQVAGNLAAWMLNEEKWAIVSSKIDAGTAARAVQLSEISMMKLNLQAARAAKKCEAHGMTDVTGFGILGHAENLALVQDSPVDLEISSLL
jgi:selenide,water dikinase